MSTQANIQDSWSPEMELRDLPPRRMVNSSFDDYNRPNIMVAWSGGGILVGVGFILFVLAMAGTLSSNKVLFILGGLILMALGGFVILLFQSKIKTYYQRAENLVVNGIPLPARIVSATNTTGDSMYGRNLKYQITLPSGDMAHREIAADERALPRMIPATVTALLDPKSGDIEIYCALPYRAVPKTTAAPVVDALAGIPTAMGRLEETAQPIPTSPSTVGGMPTLATIGSPTAPTPPNPLRPQPQPATRPQPIVTTPVVTPEPVQDEAEKPAEKPVMPWD